MFGCDAQIPAELPPRWWGSGCFTCIGLCPDLVAGVLVGYYLILDVICLQSRVAFLSVSVLRVRQDRLCQVFGFLMTSHVGVPLCTAIVSNFSPLWLLYIRIRLWPRVIIFCQFDQVW